MRDEKHREIAIIGAGPAGIAAAIQLRRYSIRPLVFEAGQIGGLLRNANLVENLPGFPQGISGGDLAERMKSQFLESKPELVPQTVTSLKFDRGRFALETETEGFSSDFAIVAAGTIGNIPADIAISEAARPRIATEIVPFAGIEGKDIAIIGAGDAALDYALNLAKKNHVVLLNRSADFKALPILLDRAKSLPNIDIRLNTLISAIALDRDERLSIAYKNKSADLSLSADFLIFAIGRSPKIDFLSEGLNAAKDGLIEAERLYFAGDIARGIFRQTAIAMGDGVLAAMRIAHRISEGRT